ncbi:glycosyltransferase family 2 protein [Patescibacteria group bacterium]
MLDLTIIIINFNTKDLTLACLNSIYKSKPKLSFQIVVIDNASKQDIKKDLKNKFPNVKFIKSNKNLGFAGGNNKVIRKIKGESKYYLLLNSDTKVFKGSLDALKNYAKENEIGIASCKLTNPDGSFQPNAGRLPKPLPVFFWLSGLDDVLRFIVKLPSYQERNESYYEFDREVGWVSGSVMLIDEKVITTTGLLDEKIFMYCEDTDYCLRATKDGFKVGWTKSTKIMHIGGASSVKARYIQWLGEFKGLLYLYKKHYNTFLMYLLKITLYIFIFIRVIAFYIVGKPENAKTYAKILKNL